MPPKSPEKSADKPTREPFVERYQRYLRGEMTYGQLHSASTSQTFRAFPVIRVKK